MTYTTRLIRGLGIGGALVLAACGDFTVPYSNAPTENQLTENPTRAILARAATGLFAGVLNDVGGEIQQWGLYGRELYNLLGNDPRETGEELRGPQDPGGRAGGVWAAKYAHIRSLNAYLRAIENTAELSAQEKLAARGFARTLKAHALHRLALRTGALGIPIDVDREITADPAPFVSQTEAFDYVVALLDSAATDLAGGGDAFPFTFGPGFTGFTTPATFVKFTRGLEARVEVNRALLAGCGAPCFTAALTALNQSFLTTTGLPANLGTGVYYGYDGAAGEPTNPITENLTQQRYYVHPSVRALVQHKGNGDDDQRWTDKFRAGTAKTLNNLTGEFKPILYNTNTATASASNLGADIPLLKNEELILLRAEANLGLGNKAAAIADIDLIRTSSGGLAASGLTAASSTDAITTELLYNRLMSLVFEQGVRWLDARKYGRLAQLPLDRAGDAVFTNMLVPVNECDARGLTVPCTP
ncbi:MAG: RagB/SusD family nutrient uptake outer membrane protein [Gemmatimonadales bacterium]